MKYEAIKRKKKISENTWAMPLTSRYKYFKTPNPNSFISLLHFSLLILIFVSCVVDLYHVMKNKETVSPTIFKEEEDEEGEEEEEEAIVT